MSLFDKEDEIAIIDKTRHDEMVIETMKVINSHTDNIVLLDAIISGEIPNVKWVLDATKSS